MSKSNSKAIKVILSWLKTLQQSIHTYRAYEREFRRFEMWRIEKNVTYKEIKTLEITVYFSAISEGSFSLKSDIDKQQVLSKKTLQQARSVLNRLFDVLQEAKIRKDNPARAVRNADIVYTNIEVGGSDEFYRIEWLKMREHWIDKIDATTGSRNPLARTIMVADLAFWLAMRRSEIASAKMSDFYQENDIWKIRIHRFGKHNIELIDVPKPAMDMLRIYRNTRALQTDPSPVEKNIPLISRLRSEYSVDPWTVNQSLKLIANEKSEADSDYSSESKEDISIRDFRDDLIIEGLSMKIPAHDLTHHVRSEYAVNQSMHRLVASSVVSELNKFVTTPA